MKYVLDQRLEPVGSNIFWTRTRLKKFFEPGSGPGPRPSLFKFFERGPDPDPNLVLSFSQHMLNKTSSSEFDSRSTNIKITF
jgi:hypothetical protein